jgi:hypothetical protein
MYDLIMKVFFLSGMAVCLGGLMIYSWIYFWKKSVDKTTNPWLSVMNKILFAAVWGCIFWYYYRVYFSRVLED